MEFAGLSSWNLHPSIDIGNVPSISVPQNDLNSSLPLHNSASSLVVIDPTVENYQQLVAGVQPNSEVLILDPAKDAIDQITQVLLGQSGISSLHLVSHGESGAIQLGETWLDRAALDRYQTEFQQWSKSFTQDADILIYGCDVALGETGRTFINQFSQLTGATIAASEDLTGSAKLNGNWTLEASTGKITAPIAFNTETLSNYGLILPVDLISPGNPTLVKGSVGLDNIERNSMSGDGRYVVFTSSATLSPNDSNGKTDVFLYDRTADTITLISQNVSKTGSANGTSLNPVISFDGNSIAFVSNADDLVQSTTGNTVNNIFVWQRSTGKISLVSTDVNGNGGQQDSSAPSISDDGGIIAFQSQSQLLGTDTNFDSDVYVWDSAKGLIHVTQDRTSRPSTIEGSDSPIVSGDGNYVAFSSVSSNLTFNDVNRVRDVFLWHRADDSVVDLTSTGEFRSFNPLISQDGSRVAFLSDATKLATTDTNGASDVFVWTRSGFDAQGVVQGSIQVVSINSAGTDTGASLGGFSGNAGLPSLAISRNGIAIAFTSSAPDLVSGDTNGKVDVFVRNLVTNKTILVSQDSTGTIGNDNSGNPSLSADGTRVAFTSVATNLVAGDTNAQQDVFVRDLSAGELGKTFLISRTATGTVGNNFSGTVPGIGASLSVPILSSDGSTVAFVSLADNLSSDDSNALFDGFITSVTTGNATLISRRDPDPVLASKTGSGDSTIASDSVSAGGRYVVFTSEAPEVVNGDANGVVDVFLRDRQTNTTTLISKGAAISNGASGNATISANGRYIVFTSAASNLVAGDSNNAIDIFWVDTQTQTLKLVSHAIDSTASGNAASGNAVLSANGLFVAFTSTASNLVSTDTNNRQDVFLWNSQDESITIVSQGSAQSDGTSEQPAISNDGRYVAFISAATNLVTGDTNAQRDVFVWDRSSGAITIVSRADGATGAISDGDSSELSLSQDGRTIAFTSTAKNLIAATNSAAVQNVFIRSLDKNTTVLVSANQSGQYSTSSSFTSLKAFNPKISGDGNFVAFTSDFSDLVAKDTNGTSDVFLRDLASNTTKLISVNQSGTDSGNSVAGADGGTGSGFGTGSFYPVISNNGRYVAFSSFSSDLATGDTNNAVDVFVRDVISETTSLVSRTPSDVNTGNGASFSPVISRSGNYVAFNSAATNLISNDLNGALDVFGLSVGVTVSLSLDKTTIAESATPTPVNYTIRRDETAGALTVKLTIDPSSTASVADYTLTAPSLNLTQTASDITITLADGVAEGVLTLTPIDDALIEGTEFLNLNLADSVNYAIADGLGATSLKIVDNDSAILVGITNITTDSTEGNSGTKPFSFEVKLSRPATVPVTVEYATQDITADATDFVATSGTLTFDAGSDTQTVTVQVKGDTQFEPNETFAVNLSNPSANTQLDTNRSAIATIINDDSDPTLSISGAASITEGNSGTQPYTFTVTLSAVSTNEIKVDYAVRDVNTTSGSDYSAVPNGTLTFAPGTISQTIVVPVLGDPLYEGDEQFQIVLSNPIAAVLPDAQKIITGTIVNDDTAPTLTIETVASQSEATSPYNFVVKLSEASGLPVTVKYSTIAGNATAGEDFTAASDTLTFAAGETSKIIPIAIINDTEHETNETFSVQLSSPTNATLPTSSATATIIDDDPVSTDPTNTGGTGMSQNREPTLSISPATIVEGGVLSFTVSLSAASSNEIRVDFATSDGTATLNDSDYTQQANTLIFAPNELTKTILVQTTSDTKFEDNETINVTLQNPVNAALAADTAIGTITNDDPLPTLSIASTPLNEDDPRAAAYPFTIFLSNPSAKPITVNYQTVDDTAKVADGDYVATSGTVTFNPGETEKTINVKANADRKFEPDERFIVRLSAPVNADLPPTATDSFGTLLNDDPRPTVAVADPTPVKEGDSGTTPLQFTVQLSNPSSETVSIQFVTKDGKATATDYVPTTTPTTITFAPGQTEQTIAIPIIGNTRFETDKTFTVELSNPINATQITRSVATATILNDDAPPQLSIAAVPAAKPEGNSGITPFTFEVTLNTASSVAVTVPYSTVDGTATIADNDYVQASDTLTFAPGETKKTMTVNVIGDTKSEGDETFKVTLGNPVNATIQSGSATATIQEDDTPPNTDQINSPYDILWHNQTTGANMLWQPSATLLDREVQLLTIADPNWQIVGTGDFNGDGVTDLLWSYRTTGETGIWQMSPDLPVKGIFLATPGAGWEVKGVADFNRDGKPDILWRNAQTGENAIWLMNGTTIANGVLLTKVDDPSWKMATVADFNNDGNADIFWTNSRTGETGIWLMDGTMLKSAYFLPSVPDLSWQPVGSGDFNRDGFVDLLWRNGRTGENAIWLLRNGQVDRGIYIQSAPTNWKVSQVCDFNGDQNLDILWQNSSTQEVSLWLMNKETLGAGIVLPNLPDRNWSIGGIGKFDTSNKTGIVLRNTQTGEDRIWQINPSPFNRITVLDAQPDLDWQIQGTADFDRNGSADILWRNLRTRELSIWLTQTGQVTNKIAVPIALQVGTDWTIQAIGDFSGDGSPDLVWSNKRTGETAIWLFNGTQFASGSLLPNPGLNWQISGAADMNGDRSLDLIWRNTATGEIAYWLFNRTQLVRGVISPTIDLSWQIQGVADLNQDGQTDLVWRNTATGEVSVWLMNGTQLSRGIVLPNPSLDWDFVGVGDYNRDGQLDLVWRNRFTGLNAVWYLRDGAYALGEYIPSLTDAGWQVKSINNF